MQTQKQYRESALLGTEEYANRKEVWNVMKQEMKRERLFGKGLATAVLLLILLLTGIPLYAGCPAADPNADTDNDGLSDGLECVGVTLAVSGVIPYCGDGTGPQGCLDPDQADLFVVIRRATPSYIPAENTLKYFTIVRGHEIAEGDVDLSLAIPGTDPVQRAVMINENTVAGAGGGYLGELTWGVPTVKTVGQIYTRDIVDYVTSKGGDAAGFEEYIRYVLAHEFGHGMRLAPKYSDRYNGYHYSTRDNVIMQENAVVSTKGPSAPTFYFPADWSVESMAAYRLK